MKSAFTIKRLRTIYILYWFLLAYIIVALVFWFIELNLQNKIMTDYKLAELNSEQFDYQQKVTKIKEDKDKKTAQYIGEGVTFLLLIVVGAVFVFRAVRRQFRQSQQQQNFMMAITHELKTPVAITKLNLETLLKHKLAEHQQHQILSNSLQEANRLNDLCNNLLLSGQIEAGAYELTNEKINLSELVVESIHNYTIRFPNRKIYSSIDPDIYFTADRLMLQMAVNNLLDNAVKYSFKQERIEIELKETAGKIKLLVKDEGSGIPDEEKEKIFTKFYRIGNLHTKRAKGTGLGLYLTKKIIDEHRGAIRVFNNSPRGSIFEVKL